MKKEILAFIENNDLSPFNKLKTQLKQNESIHKTLDSKKIHNKTISIISDNFIFPETSNLLNFFKFTNNLEEINKRQNFFKEILINYEFNNNFLTQFKKTKPNWRPPYDIIVVTEDADTFNELKKKNCPVQLIISEQDVALLENKEIIQIIDCPEYSIVLESLPQSIFLKSTEEVYLERHLETLSCYTEIINLLKQNKTSQKIEEIILELSPLLDLTLEKKFNFLKKEEVEEKLETANEELKEKIKKLNIEGIALLEILSKGKLPTEIKEIIDDIIEKTNLPRNILETSIPLKINEEELDRLIQKQNLNKFSKIAEEIKSNSNKLRQIPKILNELLKEILFFDFIAGINKFVKKEYEFPQIKEELKIIDSENIFLKTPDPISFELSEQIKASILTGANSGGKTTLIEHLIQLISLSQIGLPTSGKNTIPLFEEIYYFAKNKGSDLKGAFETLLTQMSKIKPGNKTLILADEIESVTEPGIAGKIIAATTNYYINQNCYLIIATHLGHEIKKILPPKTRIDGIEATGLTDKFELIVSHNPVLGKLANSTPELIVEKMANKEKKEYYIFLNDFLKEKI